MFVKNEDGTLMLGQGIFSIRQNVLPTFADALTLVIPDLGHVSWSKIMPGQTAMIRKHIEERRPRAFEVGLSHYHDDEVNEASTEWRWHDPASEYLELFRIERDILNQYETVPNRENQLDEYKVVGHNRSTPVDP